MSSYYTIGSYPVFIDDCCKPHCYLRVVDLPSSSIKTDWNDILICRFPIITSSEQNKYHYFTSIPQKINGLRQYLSLQAHQLINHTVKLSEYVNIEILTDHQVEAQEIYLIPLTKTDWDIVSTQAILIEEIFLSQFAIVYENQCLRVILSSSLYAEFKVTTITSIEPSHYAKVNEYTKLIISPIITNGSDNGNDDNVNTRTNSNYKDNNNKKSKKYWSELRSKYKRLRLLPQRFRGIDTSCKTSLRSNQHNSKDVDELFDLVDETFQIESRSGGNNHFISSHLYSTSSMIPNSDITAYIHPKDYDDLKSNASEKYIIGFIHISTISDLIINPLSTSTVVRIKKSTFVRYGHISLHETTRLNLGLSDYTSIDLRLLDYNKLPLRRPQEVSFRPVVYDIINIHNNHNSHNSSIGSTSTGRGDGNIGTALNGKNIRISKESTSSVDQNSTSFDFEMMLSEYKNTLSCNIDFHADFSTDFNFDHPIPLVDKSLISIPYPIVEGIDKSKDAVNRRDYVVTIIYDVKRNSSKKNNIFSSSSSSSSSSSTSEAEAENTLSTVLDDSTLSIPNLLMLQDDLLFHECLKSGIFTMDSTPITVSITGSTWNQLKQIHSNDDNNVNNSNIYKSKYRSTSEIHDYISSNVVVTDTTTTATTSTSTTENSSRYFIDSKLESSDIFSIFHETIKPILEDILSQFHPKAVYHRLVHNISPVIGSILIGPTGSGKSSILDSILYQLEQESVLSLHVIRIDCKSFKGKSTKHIISELRRNIENAKNRSPSLLIIDDIDILCPAYNYENEVVYSSHHDATALISLQLERLLTSLSYNHSKLHTNSLDMTELSTSQSMNRFGKTMRMQYHNIEETIDYDKIEKDIYFSIKDQVYVLASSQSPSTIFSRLTHITTLRTFYSIQRLTPSVRYRIFESLLQSHCISTTRLHSSNQNQSKVSEIRRQNSLDITMNMERDKFNRITEGFILSDFYQLVKQISSEYVIQKYSQFFHPAETDSIQWANIIPILESYIPIHSVDATTGIHQSFHSSNNTKKESNYTIGWNDIGGMKEVKKQIKEILQYPTLFHRFYALSPVRLPKGILLYGSTGVGKTLLAEAVAKECGLNLISIKGPQLLNKYIGASEKAVRDIFDQARSSGRSTIIFFDEFEALASKRGKDTTGVTDRVVNQLLTFLDGVEDSMGSRVIQQSINVEDDVEMNPQIFVMAATSRPDLIDVALLRPGRIEHHIYLGLPSTISERKDIMISLLQSQTTGNILSIEMIDMIDRIASSENVKSFSGADFKALVNTAYSYAVHEAIETINHYGEESIECKIQFYHLEKAWKNTKPSISSQDIQHYHDIYARFQRDTGVIANHSVFTMERSQQLQEKHRNYSSHETNDDSNDDSKNDNNNNDNDNNNNSHDTEMSNKVKIMNMGSESIEGNTLLRNVSSSITTNSNVGQRVTLK